MLVSFSSSAIAYLHSPISYAYVPLYPYPSPTQSPVLTYRMLVPEPGGRRGNKGLCKAFESGLGPFASGLAYDAFWGRRGQYRPSIGSYAVSGTDLAYAATRRCGYTAKSNTRNRNLSTICARSVGVSISARTVTKLLLSGNDLGPMGARYLGDILVRMSLPDFCTAAQHATEDFVPLHSTLRRILYHRTAHYGGFCTSA
eukprot:3941762-Rhodomonas_salina.1